MAYQVIARKWRPQTFDEVTGQEPITRTLRNAIEHQRLHHAYLFSGARGVGKTTTARLLAKALNCHKATLPTATPCRTDDPDACPSCSEISESRSIDVQEIDAASHTGIDNVRETIIGSIGFAPSRDRYKVFVIDEVHMLSTSSFNALLKTIEEPPARVVFIMATTEQHKVPETILSRCQQFEFRTIAGAKIFDRLRLIADAEKISIPDDALREIARSGEGSMRDAQSAFDQVISFAGSEIKKEDVEMALGVTGADILIRVVQGIANHQPAEALAVVDDVVMRGHDLRNFCRDLLAHFRDLLVSKVSDSQELLESAICDRDELKRQSELFSEADLVRFFHSLAETETLLKTAAHPRYQLEVGLVKLMEMRRLEPLNQLIERLAALEESARTGKPSTVSAKTSSATNATKPPASSSSPSGSFSEAPFSKSKAAVTSSAAAASGSYSAAATKTAVETEGKAANEIGDKAAREPAAASAATSSDIGFAAGGSEVDQIKAALEKRRKMLLVTALEGALSATLEGNELCLEFAPDARHLRDTLAKSENVKILREVCKEIGGRDLGVRFVITDAEAGDAAVSGAPASKEETERREQQLDKQRLRQQAEKDPTVQQMLRTFRGEIVDVKRVDEK
ncbi:MAG TPA: DNA polymerase III subunit gamma/tau [Pyrinomonadaceae bacterium]|jgi:DNA polymerase-3 subunit gamma/tau|nr:DNA polymerase III subunit gamma/tau [Pyrinomonadaceae bacterium]